MDCNILICVLLAQLICFNPSQILSSYKPRTPHLPVQIIPLYGPMLGGISITIRGSNLGIHKEDIKSITVAGEPCIHQKDKYSISTR